MSDKKDNSKSIEYRKNKKINKAKIRVGQRNKDFLINEDSILNTLPSGAFDIKPPDIKPQDTKREVVENIKIKEDILENNEDYEEFDESYFEQIPYTKEKTV